MFLQGLKVKNHNWEPGASFSRVSSRTCFGFIDAKLDLKWV